jgi:CarboxypepD_reg-like domain/TonB-dependent Receptor Plug Domain
LLPIGRLQQILHPPAIMRLLSVCFLLLLSFTVSAQDGSISGHVVDAKTGVPLSFASVYINNTTLGTVTNEGGDFALGKLPIGENELIVSYVGYKSYHSRVNVADSIAISVSVRLIPETVNLKEVNVNSTKDDQWNRRYEKFRKLFFGNSPYTRSCKIFNPWVLDFQEDESGLLTAKAYEALEIENPGLGYRITYQLLNFSARVSTFKINGYVRFEEMETVDTVLEALWSKRRAEIYQESYRKLFKSIVNGRAEQNGFLLFEDISGESDVVRKADFRSNLYVSLLPYSTSDKVYPGPGDNRFTINLPSRLEVHYVKKMAKATIYRGFLHPVSWIETSGGSLDINKEGIVLNPSRMTVSGAFSESRIAEILPYDYIPPAVIDPKEPIIAKKTTGTLAGLVEQPYVQTDRPYYYPNDNLFFKAYMNYVTPPLRDSLSHVLYVELINPSDKILARKVLPIDSGTTHGNIRLPSNISIGDYVLRAYTRWMLNFDPHYIFSNPIKILADNQLARIPEGYNAAEGGRVIISSLNDECVTREKIILTIEAKDFFGYPIASNLSVSVTDMEQASPPLNESNILRDYAIDETYLPDTTLRRPAYAIQYGIDFNGRFVTKRKKPSQGVLTVFQENADDVFGIITNEQGIFRRHLEFTDSVEFLVQANTSKGKMGKIVMDGRAHAVPPITHVEPLRLVTYTPSDVSMYHISNQFRNATMLENVTVEAKRIEKVQDDEKPLQTDFRIKGDWLRNNFSTDLLSAIQSRVPGLRVMHFTDKHGVIKKYLVFLENNFSFGDKTQECLVEVDGVVLNSTEYESTADQLEDMSVNEIESINVIKYGAGARYGARGANGVIIVKTGKGNYERTTDRSYDRSKMQVVKLAGYSTSADFVSPDYSDAANDNDRLDARSTIYWNPKVVTDGKEPIVLSFFAADIPTQYRIVVEGVDEKGQPVRGEKLVSVTQR